jgi:antitoxin ChpS
MYTAKLKSVGGSVMFAIPKPVLEGLNLRADQKVGLSISDGRIIVEPCPKPRYTLAELMAECDLGEPFSDEDRAWLNAPPAGDEII